MDMTANEITDRLILDNQNLVVEELMRHDESLWEELQNFDRTAKRKGRGNLIGLWLLLVGTNNERTGTLHGRSDTGDSGTDGVREITKTQRGFQLDLEIELDVSWLLHVFL